MNIKTILLGAAAGLMGVSAAAAADLPGEPTPAAVDYVKVCDTFGAGFFYIPGSETCLKLSGRIRAGMTFDKAAATAFVDGRVGFDARTATELGTLRSFFRIKTNGTAVAVDNAYLQLGFLTVGYASNFFDSFGSLYGDSDRNMGSETRWQASVLVDDLGGGFYAGLQALATEDGLSQGFDGDSNANDSQSEAPDLQAIIGIKDQPWGSAAAGVWYSFDDDGAGNGFWAAKLGGTVKATDQLSFAAEGFYKDYENGGNMWMAGIGASYAATDAVTVNANVAYYDGETSDDGIGATLGVDYTIVTGLVATAEVHYDDYTFDGDTSDKAWTGLLRLTREW